MPSWACDAYENTPMMPMKTRTRKTRAQLALAQKLAQAHTRASVAQEYVKYVLTLIAQIPASGCRREKIRNLHGDLLAARREATAAKNALDDLLTQASGGKPAYLRTLAELGTELPPSVRVNVPELQEKK